MEAETRHSCWKWLAGVVSEQILVSILSVSMDPHEMSCAEAALALALPCGDLKSEDLLRSFLLMWVVPGLVLKVLIGFCRKAPHDP